MSIAEKDMTHMTLVIEKFTNDCSSYAAPFGECAHHWLSKQCFSLLKVGVERFNKDNLRKVSSSNN